MIEAKEGELMMLMKDGDGKKKEKKGRKDINYY